MSSCKSLFLPFTGVAFALLLSATVSYPAKAQQAPLPPGTSAPDTPPKPAQDEAATPLADAEGDIALQNYTKARSLLPSLALSPPNRCPRSFRSRLS